MGATGYVMTIPEEVLNKLELADTKINAIAKSSENTKNVFKSAFTEMANSVDPLLKQLTTLKGLQNIKLNTGFKNAATESEKAAASIAALANQINKVNNISSSPNTYVLAWQGINENLKIQQQRLDAINRSIKEYENTLSQIQGGKGGVLSTADQQAYTSNIQEAESIRQTIELYRQKQQAIVNYQLEQKKIYDNQQKLKNLESDSRSLPEQRKAAELEKLNEAYRTGTSLLQKQAKAEDDLAKAARNVFLALDKAAKAEEKKNSARADKANKEAARAEEQYAKALTKSEVTIVQRARKIEALANAQRALTQTGRDYSSQLSKIASETRRLQKANDEAGKSMQKLKTHQSSVSNTTDQLTRKFALLFSVAAIQGYVEKLVEVRGEFELQQRALQSILQDKDKADEVWSKTVQLAVRSPFTVKELVTYTKQLAAYRIESDKLYDTNKMLADVSAGLGVSMDRLILAFGQVKAANYLRASEVRQFTEAGVNILGELSNYYSELEGKMVSVGDVQERITKRMVQFGDVEEIFKRITSAGGLFYNMQEVQAETLAGMISNLKDTFDLMFNDIGKANDGVLKGFISLVKDIVNNWEKISQIGIPIIMTMITRMAILKATTNGIVPIMSNFVKVSIIGFKQIAAQLSGATVKARALRIEASKLGATPLNIWLTALTVVLATIWEIHNAIIASRKEQEELNKISAQGQFDALDMASNYERLANVVSDTTKSYEEQDETLKELKRTYGNILPAHLLEAETIRQLKGEYDGATQAIFNYVAAKTKERQINIISENEGDKVASNAEKLAKAIQSQVKESGNAEISTSRILAVLTKLRKEYENGELELYNYKKRFRELMRSFTGINYDFELPTSKTKKKQNFFDLSGETQYEDQLSEFMKSVVEYSDKIKDVMADNSIEFGNFILNNLSKEKKVVDEQVRNVQSALNTISTSKTNPNITKDDINRSYKTITDFYKYVGEVAPDIEKIVNNSILIKDETIKINKIAYQKFIKDISNLKIDKQDFETYYKYIEDVQDKINSLDGTDFQKYVRSFMDSFSKMNGISLNGFENELAKSEDNLSSYTKAMKDLIPVLEEEIELLQRPFSALYGTKSEEEINLLKERLEYARAWVKLNSVESKKGTGESEADKRLKKQISLLKEVGKEYEKNLKYYSKEEAIAKTRKDYSDTFKEAGLGDMIMSMSFDPSGIINGIEEVGKQASKKMRLEVERAISGIQSEVDLDVRVENVESVKREIDNLFSGYELSVQLEGLGLDKSLISQLFKVDTFSLDAIKEKLKEIYPDISALSEEQLKVYNDSMKKITDMERKELEERFKNYSQYLKKTVSERVSIELEAQEKIAKIPKEFQADQRAEIINNIQKEAQKNLDKQTWDEFKGSDLYIKLFEDLDNVSTRTLEKLREKLLGLRNSLQDLPADELKTIISQLDKVDKEITERNPFKNLLSNAKEYINYLKNKGELEDQFVKSTEKENELQGQVEKQEKIYELRKKERDEAIKTSGADSEQAKEADRKVQSAYSLLSVTKRELAVQKNVSKDLGGQIDKGKKLGETLVDAANKFATRLNQVNQLLSDIQSSFGGMMSDSANDFLSSTQEIIGGVTKTAEGVGRMAAGDWIGGGLQALGGLANTIGSVLGIGDKKKEKQIQKEIKQVEKLQRAYEKLGKAITDAYTIDTLNMSYENAQRNIQDQIKSYQNMIAAEEDKKDTDWDRIDEWKEAIIDLQEQADQLRSQKLNELGGFGSGADMKSAAEEFASAWMDAYRETGDGLDALTDKWDEYINNIIMKQMALRGMETFLKPVMDLIDKSLEDAYFDTDEQKAIDEAIEKSKKGLNEFWKKIAESFNIPIGDEGGSDNASTLSKSVQGVTETTANVIEAYLNSMRFFVSDSNMVLNNFYMAFTSIDPLLNPMYSELNNQTKLLRSIDERLASVITYSGDHPNGGASIKVLT